MVPMLRIGTSGWHYRDWRGAFYPKDLATDGWLQYYARHFDTVEINNSFYRLPEASTFEAWKEQTPAGFVFTVKASRFLTHYKRLREPEEPVARLIDRASALGEKLGPVLLQLPPNLPRDAAQLAAVLEQFAGRARVACEFRHPSWFEDDVYRVLEAHDAALCLTDRRGHKGPIVRTASWTVLRMHEGTARPLPCYGTRALHSWAERLAELGGDGYVYFNNDRGACAIRNARTFAGAAERVGLPVHRPAAPAPAQ
jgi:uncharacterized protein YecE (DUF72 family)